MKISIYELLGLVKDGKAPNRIIYDNYIWNWTGDDYVTETNVSKEQFLITGMYYTWLTEFLREEVEIIEEKENNKIKKIYECWTDTENEDIKFLVQNINQLGNKVNELIDVINELKRNNKD